MMGIVAIALFTFGVGMICWGIWLENCNHRTYRQRTALIPSPSDPQFYAKIAAIDAISYERHCWLLATFRDPMPHYPALLTAEPRA